MIEDLRQARRNARLPLPRTVEFLYPVLLLVGLLVGWQLWVSVGHVKAFEFPKPTAVLHVFIHSDILRNSAWVTVRLMVLGFVFAIALALALAFLTFLFRPFEIGVFPLLVSTQFVPLIALTPMFVIWMGLGDKPKYVMIMLFAFFPVLITTLAGLRAVELEKLHLARSAGASLTQTFFRIRLPGALPYIFSGLKIAVLSCLIATVVVEFFIGGTGLGSIIVKAEGVGDTTGVIASVVYLAIIGGAGFLLVSGSERLLVPWAPNRRSQTDGRAR